MVGLACDHLVALALLRASRKGAGRCPYFCVRRRFTYLPTFLPCKLPVIPSVSVSYLLYSLAQVLFGIRAQFQCCLIGGALALR